MPEEYQLIRAARYLGVAPWELAKRPICWMHWALTYEFAEDRAVEIAQKIQAQREKMAAE